MAVGVDSDMPVAVVGASANENEKRHAEELLGNGMSLTASAVNSNNIEGFIDWLMAALRWDE